MNKKSLSSCCQPEKNLPRAIMISLPMVSLAACCGSGSRLMSHQLCTLINRNFLLLSLFLTSFYQFLLHKYSEYMFSLCKSHIQFDLYCSSVIAEIFYLARCVRWVYIVHCTNMWIICVSYYCIGT